jgi:hypothetical protein
MWSKKRNNPQRVTDALQAELQGGPAWMYPWRLTDEVTTPLIGEELPSVHATRATMIEPIVRAALAEAGPLARAIDIACHEGWFAHRLLEWGADEVVGVDIRELNVRRARLLRDHYDLDPTRLRFEEASVYDLDPDVLGQFDVVLVLGLIYHLENPVGALRVARSLCRGVCVVESQLTQHDATIRHGWGITDEFLEEPASWASKYEPLHEQETQPLAAHGGVISLIPNRAALLQAMDAAGFAGVHVLTPAQGANPQYEAGDRAVVAGTPSAQEDDERAVSEAG